MCVAKAISLLKTFLLVTALVTVGLSQSQPPIKQREKLLMALERSQSDTSRVNILMDLGQYYLDKSLDLQTDIDSATSYVKQAEGLNNMLARKSDKDITHYIQVLLKIGAFYCFKPLELQADLDTALVYVRQAEQLSKTNQLSLWPSSLELLGNLYWEKHDTTLAQNYFTRAIRQYEQRRDTTQLALIWLSFGEHYPHSKQTLTQKINCYKRAFTYFHQLKNQNREHQLLDYISYTFLLQGRNEESFSTMWAVLQQYRKENYGILDYVYYRLSRIEICRGNYKSATYYNLKAIQFALLTNQTKHLGDYYAQISTIYQYLNDLDKQLVYSRKALYFFKKDNSLPDIHDEAGQICQLLIQKKRGSEAFSFYQSILRQYPPGNPYLKIQSFRNLAFINEALGKYDRAESYYLQFFDQLKQFDNLDPVKENSYHDIGQFYLKTKQFAKARYYFNRYFIVTSQLKNPQVKQISYYDFFKLDSAQGNFQSALTYFQRYTAIKDSIFTAAKVKQIEGLQVQYESKNKEHRIELLTTQSREQQAHIQQANFTRNVTFGGAALLLVLLGLIYNRYLLKKNQQELIQLKNQDLEELVSQKELLLKEIHHRVKNNLQLIISLLQSQGKYLFDKAAISAIEQSEHRVRAMALIHQKLYLAENLSKINMMTYIQEMAEQLSDSFDPQKRIALQFDIARLELDVSQAIPLGLIINEAITNAFKYAFPGERLGNIYLSLTRIDSEHYQLRVKDDGVGLPDYIDLSLNKSMGANIMRRLCKQLRATIQVNSRPGVDISVAFTLFHLNPSPSYVA